MPRTTTMVVRVRRDRSIRRLAWVAVSVVACTDPITDLPSATGGEDDDAEGPPGGGGGDGASATSTSGAPPPVITTEGDDTSGGDPEPGDDEQGGVFLPYPDFEPPPFECDVIAQDCPAGEKCMPWANDGGPAWNATRCSPIFPDPGQAGDACLVEGSGVSGIDDCDLGLMCWDVDARGVGYCEDMCTGSTDSPICENPADLCAIANDGAIALCLPSCDPVTPECPGTQVCSPLGRDWACAPAFAPQEGTHGQPCSAAGLCAPGHACVASFAFTMCEDASGCCASFCDLNDEGADEWCAALDPAQQCEPFYDRPPAGYEHVGVCIVPP